MEKLQGSLKRRIRTLKRSLNKQDIKLAECLQWEDVYHKAELLQANLYRIRKGDKEVEVSDWEKEGTSLTIILNPLMKPHEEVAKRFKRAQKLKKGLSFVKNEKEKIEAAIQGVQDFMDLLVKTVSEEDFQALKSSPFFPKIQEKKEVKETSVVKPYKEHVSKSGFRIWVGKSAAKNDQLTFQCAKGNDLWLHAAEYAGSHVVICCKKDSDVDKETFDQALKLALYHSKARKFGEGEVVATQVKHVRRFGREKGRVQIAEEKRYLVRL